MTDLSDKAVKLAQTAGNIAIYQEIIDVLQTQVSYFQKKLKEQQDIMQTQHGDLLLVTNVVTTRNVVFPNGSKQGG